MEKKYCYLLLAMSISIDVFSQIAVTTWVSGDISTNQPGIYGVKGIASSSNKPGGRYRPASWVDASGIFWLMGGEGYASSGIQGFLNDLWKYNPATGEWTWVSGENAINQIAVYGTKGIADLSNKPGARSGSATWIDAAGNLWLMGGTVPSSAMGINDLWKYDPIANKWTWLSGDMVKDLPGVYGTKGIASSLNKPGARFDATSWVDAIGNMWLMGGQGFSANLGSGAGVLNDIWKYNPITNEWTWMSGGNSINQLPVYGIKGVPSSSNNPGGRREGTSWLDSNGDLWVMGGLSFMGYRDDLWKYRPTTDQWIWIGGTNSINQAGVYGTKGVSSSINRPGARLGAAGWIDADGNFWLIGGSSLSGYLNDIWQYNHLTNQWTWLSGDNIANQPGIYGTKGIASPCNFPGARYRPASWLNADGDFWVMGGVGTGIFNDLWKIDVTDNTDPCAPEPDVQITCPGNQTVYTDPGACTAIVNGINASVSPGSANETVNYTLNGVTSYSGSGSASGLNFNKGITTVSYSLASDPSKACSFTVNVVDNQKPLLICPPVSPLCNNLTGIYAIPPLIATDNCGVNTISYSVTGATIRSGSTADASGPFRTGENIITWTVSDADGNIASCQIIVVVQPGLTVVISDAQAASTGVNTNTVYLGYTPASQLKLSAQANGGGGNFIYNWTPGNSTGSSLVVDAATLSAGIQTYTVNITDGNGCTASASKQIIVKDIRCGNDNRKVNICHITDNDRAHTNELCIDEAGVLAHLVKGCKLGECVSAGNISMSRPGLLENDKAALALKVAPNPSKNFFTVVIQGNISTEPISLKIIDLSGRLVEVRNNLSVGQSLQFGHKYQAGTYIVELSQGSKKVHNKIVKSGN